MTFTPDKRRRRWSLLAALLLAPFAALPAWGEGNAADEAIAKAAADLEHKDAIAAETELKKALAAGARPEAVAALMGEAQLQQEDFAGARSWLATGAFSPATAARGWRMLSRLELADGNLGAAEAALDKALAIAPHDAQLWVDIGRLSYRQGRQDEAVIASVRAVELEPDNVEALQFRGQLQRDSAGLQAALPWFERALAKAPDDLDLLGQYAATLGEIGRARDMLKVTRRMLELDGRNAQAFYLQAVLAARAGMFDLAERLLWRAGEDAATTPAGVLLSSSLELRAGHSALALDGLEQLYAQQPGNEAVQLLVASALAQGGNWSELADRFTPVAERADASRYLLLLVARAHEALGDRLAAAPLLDRAAAPSENRIHAVPEKGDVEVLAGRWRNDPSDLRNAIAYVRVLLALGMRGEAVMAADATLARFPGSYDARILAGDARLLSGDPRGALTVYRAAAMIRQPQKLVRRMAYALEQTGDKGAAATALRDYLAQHPRSREARLLLARE